MKQKNKFFNLIKKLFIALLVTGTIFIGFVAMTTRNTKNMTIRQRVLKTIYPAITWWSKLTGKNAKVFTNESPSLPPQSIYELSVILINGEKLSLSQYRGKKLLLVNTASDCGYTDQYTELQSLYEENKERLMIIGFPANNFKQQEKGTDEEIAQFCKLNYGVTFPLVKKSSVLSGDDQHPVFQWLSDKNKNGWTNKKPSWNFSKYLVNENGMLINYFDPSISPVSKEVIEAIRR